MPGPRVVGFDFWRTVVDSIDEERTGGTATHGALSGIWKLVRASGRALFFPLVGDLYYTIRQRRRRRWRRSLIPGLCNDAPVAQRQILAYIPRPDFFTYDRAKQKEKAVTSDGRGPIRNRKGGVCRPGGNGDRSTGSVGPDDEQFLRPCRRTRSKPPSASKSPTTMWQPLLSATPQRDGRQSIESALGDPMSTALRPTWMTLGRRDIYLAR